MIDFVLEFTPHPTTKEAVQLEQNVQRCTIFVQVGHAKIIKKINYFNAKL
jgi:hypothetical protein